MGVSEIVELYTFQMLSGPGGLNPRTALNPRPLDLCRKPRSLVFLRSFEGLFRFQIRGAGLRRDLPPSPWHLDVQGFFVFGEPPQYLEMAVRTLTPTVTLNGHFPNSGT